MSLVFRAKRVIVPIVLIHRGYRFRIYPTPEQEMRLRAWQDALRFRWNIANEQRLMCLAKPKDERVYLSAFDQQLDLTALRAELGWLRDVPYNVASELLVQLGEAWRRCFNRSARRPRWKSKSGSAIGITEPRWWRLAGGVVVFPKVGAVRALVHRQPQGKPIRCTINRDACGDWFASLVYAVEVADPAPRAEPVVALDRGVVNAVADSDGNVVEAPRFYAEAMRRLARAQRNLSRKRKGSKNREKARLRVARLHRKVARQREWFTHNLSAHYAKSHGKVVVEDLKIGSMVRANRGLSRGILDAGWGMLVSQLEYKLAETGGTLVKVPAQYSSQTCHACGHVARESRRSQSEFVCVGCGVVDHADLNAAKVLLTRASRPGLPVEGSPTGARRSRKLRVPRAA